MSESHWQSLDRLGIVLGLLAFFGTVYSAWMWGRYRFAERRGRQAIPIRLTEAATGALLYTLPYAPSRRTLLRSEVLGLLGMIPSRQQRYDWRHLASPEFMLHLEEIQDGRRHTLEIPVTAEEYGQLETGPGLVSESVPASAPQTSANPELEASSSAAEVAHQAKPSTTPNYSPLSIHQP